MAQLSVASSMEGLVNRTDASDRDGTGSAESTDTEAEVAQKEKRKGRGGHDTYDREEADSSEGTNTEAVLEAKQAPKGLGGVIDMIDTYDREEEFSTDSSYTEGDAYYKPGFVNEPDKRLPKAGAYARTGMWRAKYVNSVLEAEAKGPNASAELSASLKGVKAMAGAEIASASASAGPLKAKIGLGVDTGFKIGVDGVGVKVLGTGFNVGPQTSVSLLGSEVGCSFM